jgi:hypothetical protein
VKSQQKEPLVADWPHQATNEEGRLRFWSRRFPDCNWAVATGPESEVFVLDVDGEQGRTSLQTLELQGFQLPRTLITQTGRGSQIWLKWPANGIVVRNSVGKLAPGLDVRGVGGYVLVPPSVHPNGAVYEFVNENVTIASAPEWLLKKLAEISPATGLGTGAAKPIGEVIPEGRRNDTLMSLAGTMRHRGMTPTAIEAALLEENAARCVPPLGAEEIKAIVASVSRYEPAQFPFSRLSRNQENNRPTHPRGWPASLTAEAFQGLAAEFVQLVEPETESDVAALLFSFLVTMGSIIGRGPYYQVGGDRHYTNLFTVIVGESAKARKGTSWGELRRFVALVDQPWCEQRVAGGLTSGEGLIHAVRDPLSEVPAKRKGSRVTSHEAQRTDVGVDDKRLLVVEGEFSQALQSASRDGNTLSAIIRLAWDGVPLRVLAKNAKAACLKPHISVLAHITVAELQRLLTGTDIANGFANRFLWVCATRSKCLPFGGAVNAEALIALAARVKEAIQSARTAGRIEFGSEARAEWSRVYPALSEGKLGLLGAITARAEAQAVRLAMLYALLDQSVEIQLVHLRAALAVWCYCEDSARYIFGDSLGDPTADEILRLLRGAGSERVTRNDLTNHFKRNKSSAELERALAVLHSHGLARVEQRATGGRTAEVWKAVTVQNNKQE